MGDREDGGWISTHTAPNNHSGISNSTMLQSHWGRTRAEPIHRSYIEFLLLAVTLREAS